MEKVLFIEFPASTDKVPGCIVRDHMVPDHPEYCPQVHHINLKGEKIPDHRVVVTRGFYCGQGIRVIEPVEGTFEHGKVPAL